MPDATGHEGVVATVLQRDVGVAAVDNDADNNIRGAPVPEEPGDPGPTKETAVAKRNYPALQMHRFPYTDLTESQVLQALRPAANGPGSKSALSDVLAGKRLRIVTDEGPTLEYHFRSGRELELSENGGKAAKSGYGAMQSRQPGAGVAHDSRHPARL